MTTFTNWLKAAGIRAIRTFAQACIAAIGTEAVGLTQVSWQTVISLGAMAAVLSILTSLTGLPELTSTDK